MGIEVLDDVFKSVLGGISKKEGKFLYNLAKNCSKGVIVEIGASHGLSTLCLGLGSKDGHGSKVYSVDPQNNEMYTLDNGQDIEGDEGHPSTEYYINAGIKSVLEEFNGNLKKFNVDDVVIPIVNYSECAYWNYLGEEWNIPIEVLFIDGDHRYNYVKTDLMLWGKRVVSGGVIVMHDMVIPGVSRTIKEMVRGNPRYSSINDDMSGEIIFNAVVK